MKNLEDDLKAPEKDVITSNFFDCVMEGVYSMIPFKKKLGLFETYNLMKKDNQDYGGHTMGRLTGQLCSSSLYVLFTGSVINIVKNF